MAHFQKLWRWEVGRQQTGYHKMLICGAKWPLKFDVYILKFPEGSEVSTHLDKVKSGKHYRLNIILKKAKAGGQFMCKQPIFETDRIKLFRPDIMPHGVTRVESGNRYLLSIGWLVKP